MKIIGKGQDRYIIEATENELANAMGFGGVHYRDWQETTAAFRDGRSSNSDLKIGSVLNVSGRFETMGRLLRGKEDVAKASETMRALATLIDRTLTEIIPPAIEAEIPPASEGA